MLAVGMLRWGLALGRHGEGGFGGEAAQSYASSRAALWPVWTLESQVSGQGQTFDQANSSPARFLSVAVTALPLHHFFAFLCLSQACDFHLALHCEE